MLTLGCRQGRGHLPTAPHDPGLLLNQAPERGEDDQEAIAANPATRCWRGAKLEPSPAPSGGGGRKKAP